jgi:DNA-directed RNA polymerase specialized sigma24 family protein
MRRTNYTSMGGLAELFQTTQWSALGQAAEDLSSPLASELVQRYWKPIYCYLRRKGYNNEQAKDLTQGFFQEIVLGRNLLRRADRGKGSFRKLVLTALERYLHSEHRKRTARKRQHQCTRIPLTDDLAETAALTPEMTPEDSFNYAWISSLLDTVLSEVEVCCMEHGLAAHWKVFEDRVLQPIVSETEAPSLADLCKKHGIDSRCRVSNMIVTVSRRLQAALRRHVGQYLTGDDTMDAELQELLTLLSKKGAR